MDNKPTIGELNQRITIQQRGGAVDALGHGAETWTDVATVWAAAQPLRGREFFAAGAVQSEADVRFRIRWMSGIDATMRAVWKGVPHALVAEPIDVDGGRHTLELMTASGVRDG